MPALRVNRPRLSFGTHKARNELPRPLSCPVLYCDRNAYKKIWADSVCAGLSGRMRGRVWRLRPLIWVHAFRNSCRRLARIYG
jgi:hypothetical protein